MDFSQLQRSIKQQRAVRIPAGAWLGVQERAVQCYRMVWQDNTLLGKTRRNRKGELGGGGSAVQHLTNCIPVRQYNLVRFLDIDAFHATMLACCNSRSATVAWEGG